MSKKVFVTGGTGFLGAYLLRYLFKKGYEIRALKRQNSPLELVAPIKDKIEWIEGDILDQPALEEGMNGVQQVFHSAGMISFDGKNKDQMMEVNSKGTANVVNAALYCGIEKLVHVSSIAAIGRVKNERNVSERTKWERSKLNTYYGITKYLGEQEVWRGHAEGLPVAIVNPSIILGSGFWNKGTCLFFPRIYRGLRFYPPGGTGFVDVRDVARFMVQLMESDVEGERFILNGENLSYKQLFEIIAMVLEVDPPKWKANRRLAEMVAIGDWVRAILLRQKSMITRETIRQTFQRFYFQNDKSLQFFDFNYTPVLQTITESGRQFRKCLKENISSDILPI